MVVSPVGPLSCAKVAGALHALAGFVIGALLSLMSLVGAVASDSSEGAALGVIFGIGAIVALPLLYGALGCLMTPAVAWLYNAVAARVGGIEVDLR
jgi:hypothetical protein